MKAPLLFSSIISAILMSGCAPRADKVEAVLDISSYSEPTCQAVEQAHIEARANLELLEKRQNRVARQDTVSVMLFGVPASKMTNMSVETELAHAKGRIKALQARITACQEKNDEAL